MTDPTNIDTQHPAVVTATGLAAPPSPSITGTDDQHPAVVTRPGLSLGPALPATPAAASG